MYQLEIFSIARSPPVWRGPHRCCWQHSAPGELASLELPDKRLLIQGRLIEIRSGYCEHRRDWRKRGAARAAQRHLCRNRRGASPAPYRSQLDRGEESVSTAGRIWFGIAAIVVVSVAVAIWFIRGPKMRGSLGVIHEGTGMTVARPLDAGTWERIEQFVRFASK
jgi:hypothetical protein